METRVLLGPAFMENVGKEIKTAADGTLTIGDMTKVVKAVGDAEKNEKLTHTKAITDLAQSLVEVSSRPMAGARPISPKQMELGKLATGISNMSVATVLSFGDLVNLKLAGKLMRGVEVGVWETFKSYLSTALVKLGFGVEAATKIEKAKTPDDTKKVLAEVAKNNPGSAEVVGKLDKAGTNTDVVQVMAEAPTPAAVTTPPPVEDISGLAGAADIPGAVYNSKLAQALMPITAGTGYKQVKAEPAKLYENMPENLKGLEDTGKAVFLTSLLADACDDKDEKGSGGLINNTLIPELQGILSKLSLEDKKYIAYFIGAEKENQDYKEVINDVTTNAAFTTKNASRRYAILNGLFAQGPKSGQEVLKEIFKA